MKQHHSHPDHNGKESSLGIGSLRRKDVQVQAVLADIVSSQSTWALQARRRVGNGSNGRVVDRRLGRGESQIADS
jgi:hypothetical protein